MPADPLSLSEGSADCPYCGESLRLLLDPGDAGVDYTEDCQVCCRPMIVSVIEDADGDLQLMLRREDD